MATLFIHMYSQLFHTARYVTDPDRAVRERSGTACGKPLGWNPDG